jgi:hypothetical protein
MTLLVTLLYPLQMKWGNFGGLKLIGEPGTLKKTRSCDVLHQIVAHFHVCGWALLNASMNLIPTMKNCIGCEAWPCKGQTEQTNTH